MVFHMGIIERGYMHIRTFVVFFLSMFCLGCANTYSAPKLNVPHAVINFTKSYGAQGKEKLYASVGRHQYYYVLAQEGCSDPKLAAHFHTGSLGGSSKEKRIPVETPIKIISAVSARRVISYNTVEKKICSALVQFTPRVNGKYEIMMDMALENCGLQVVDIVSKSVPLDMVQDGKKICTSEELAVIKKFAEDSTY